MGRFMEKKPALLENIALLLLCALFFFVAAGAVATGVSAYQGVSRRGEENSACRTALAYIANQVRRADAGGVEVGAYQGLDALLLTELIEGEVYTTYIYCYEGTLWELFTQEGIDLGPEAGTPLVPLAALAISLEAEGLIRVRAEDAAGAAVSMLLAPRASVVQGQW